MQSEETDDGSLQRSLCNVRDHFCKQPIYRNPFGDATAYFGITDFAAPLDPFLVEDMAEAMFLSAPIASSDIIVSIADRGSGPLAHAMALRSGLPYSLANWYPKGSPGEVEVEPCAGFSGDGVIYLNGLKRGRKVAIVMDVLKTGVTAANLIRGVQAAGCQCVCIVFACEIVEAGGRARLSALLVPEAAEGEGVSNKRAGSLSHAPLTPVLSLVRVHMRGEMTKEAVNEDNALIAPTPAEARRQRELRVVTNQAAIEDSLTKGIPLPALRLTSWMSKIKKLTIQEIEAKRHRIAKMFLGVPIHHNPHLGYPYSFFSLTDFTPPLDPQLVEDMADLCVYFGSFNKCDVVVSEADRGGGPLVQAVSVRTKLPYVLANWYSSGEGIGANSAAQVGFSGQGRIVVNGLRPEDRCIFVDDMLSSGGTAEGVINSVVKLGGIPIEGLFASEKLYPSNKAGALPQRKGKKRLNDQFPYFNVITLCQFVAEGDRTYAHAQQIGE